MSCLPPEAGGLLDQFRLSAVTREQLRLVLGDVRKLALDSLSDASVQGASRLAQERAVGRILYQRVLKKITPKRRYALTEQQASPNDPVQSWP